MEEKVSRSPRGKCATRRFAPMPQVATLKAVSVGQEAQISTPRFQIGQRQLEINSVQSFGHSSFGCVMNINRRN